MDEKTLQVYINTLNTMQEELQEEFHKAPDGGYRRMISTALSHCYSAKVELMAIKEAVYGNANNTHR